ncbi:hypothetical protein C6503_03575 [Candidatus Poribacteria bacterium]|nr:MAG: hypothetical protein C6503_03575 [Candidatus Poribacteria bacterium]
MSNNFFSEQCGFLREIFTTYLTYHVNAEPKWIFAPLTRRRKMSRQNTEQRKKRRFLTKYAPRSGDGKISALRLMPFNAYRNTLLIVAFGAIRAILIAGLSYFAGWISVGWLSVKVPAQFLFSFFYR